MKKVIQCVRDLRHDSIKDLVERRKKEFKAVGSRSSRELFKELCFCILTANYTAEGGIRIQKAIGDGFLTLSDKQLAARLKSLGHRFPNTRASYIVSARQYAPGLKRRMNSFPDSLLLREWLAKNVKGLGMKEASHFMRNVGYEDVAIIDFHIIDFLVDYGVVERPKTITPKRYLEIENVLKRVGSGAGMDMSELDLYMWYCETGKILK